MLNNCHNRSVNCFFENMHRYCSKTCLKRFPIPTWFGFFIENSIKWSKSGNNFLTAEDIEERVKRHKVNRRSWRKEHSIKSLNLFFAIISKKALPQNGILEKEKKKAYKPNSVLIFHLNRFIMGCSGSKSGKGMLPIMISRLLLHFLMTYPLFYMGFWALFFVLYGWRPFLSFTILPIPHFVSPLPIIFKSILIRFFIRSVFLLNQKLTLFNFAIC